ncbi:hypothetical protein N9K75_01990 [bacterium]|nr:hypothetical protein [bacterium]
MSQNRSSMPSNGQKMQASAQIKVARTRPDSDPNTTKDIKQFAAISTRKSVSKTTQTKLF